MAERKAPTPVDHGQVKPEPPPAPPQKVVRVELTPWDFEPKGIVGRSSDTRLAVDNHYLRAQINALEAVKAELLEALKVASREVRKFGHGSVADQLDACIEKAEGR